MIETCSRIDLRDRIINFHLIIPLSLGELTELNNFALDKGLPTIADIKLNDIDNTNRIATDYLWDANFSLSL